MDQALGALGGPFQLNLRWLLPSIALFSAHVASLIPLVQDSAPPIANLVSHVLIFGSIVCALDMKCGGDAKTHEISKIQKSFGEIPPG